ncbi:hypothetical protein TSOC_013675 [Tetrabaena socialis]|uniref:RING-type domain-containing protein n=1 Tax=Tetrabaena socialis TaxID=47790 RepID=A0A2J7ZJP5_9CHLO|nr:hypothetical protein TSOC_013675 [Tetrabaena socialis]|eukprot:PNH00495.1 hypothetical protein TSOC_013675 [Tetrabaena socialis]
MVESELELLHLVRAQATSDPSAGGGGCGAGGRGGADGAPPASPVLAAVASFREAERLLAGLSPRCPTSPRRAASGMLGVPAASGGPGAGGQLSGAAAAGAAEEEESGVCGLCFERQEEVAPSVCGHGLCAACATELCRTFKRTPLLCPFCRGPVEGFAPVAVRALP